MATGCRRQQQGRVDARRADINTGLWRSLKQIRWCIRGSTIRPGTNRARARPCGGIHRRTVWHGRHWWQGQGEDGHQSWRRRSGGSCLCRHGSVHGHLAGQSRRRGGSCRCLPSRVHPELQKHGAHTHQNFIVFSFVQVCASTVDVKHATETNSRRARETKL